jgi:hypothetical protein
MSRNAIFEKTASTEYKGRVIKRKNNWKEWFVCAVPCQPQTLVEKFNSENQEPNNNPTLYIQA